MSVEDKRIERMRSYVAQAYGGNRVEDPRKGAAAIGRAAMLREVDRHSVRHRDDEPYTPPADAPAAQESTTRETPWRIGMFRFGKGKENHEHHQE